jgi:pimeloyl-ACP methyl ester carboxylesterase
LTLLALPESDASGKRFRVSFVDPLQLDSVEVGDRVVPLAMDLDAPLDATRAMGPGFLDGFRFLVRADRFDGESRITFLQPFDPEKQPLVLVHGLMTTPRMWDTLVRELLADPVLRARYQIWLFFYPTAQPVPLSALELRNGLDEAVGRYDVRKPMVLVGYSMGGVLARAQVSALSLEGAERIAPNVRMLPPDNPVRRALVFEPRRDVGRVVFMFTPHRGSRLATLNLSAWGTRLIRLPDWVRNELADAVELAMGRSDGGFPTSIHGLSPHSGFLRELDRVAPGVPTHSIIGNRGRRGDLPSSSDGVVPFSSAHLPSADSGVIVPTGHGGFDHPLSILEPRRILRQEMVISPALSQPRPASNIPELDFQCQRGIHPVGL